MADKGVDGFSGLVAQQGQGMGNLPGQKRQRLTHFLLAQADDRHRLLVGLAPRQRRQQRRLLQITVERLQGLAIVVFAPPEFHFRHQLLGALAGMAKRAFQRSIALHTLALGGRANPVVAPQRVGQRQVFARHVAVDANAARCIGIMVTVRVQRFAAGKGWVAFRTGGVAGGGGQRSQILRIVVAVGIVTLGARQGAAAPAQQHIACLARVGGTAARRATVAKAALPGEGIAREQNLMAARAGPVDRFGAGDGAAARRRQRAQKRAARLV